MSPCSRPSPSSTTGTARPSRRARSGRTGRSAVAARTEQALDRLRVEHDDRRTECSARAGGKNEAEAAAAPNGGVELDPTAERVRELVRDREPEARPAAPVPRPERPEDALGLLRRDARARVGDRDPDV